MARQRMSSATRRTLRRKGPSVAVPAIPHAGRPVRIFLSYCHKDERYRQDFEKQLSTLKRSDMIECWDDRKIVPGEQFPHAIDVNLKRADIALLLISADFLASDYCCKVEMRQALQRHARGQALVIPVILRACDWQDSEIGGLLALPRDGRPVKSWPDRDQAWLDVVNGVRQAIEEMFAARACTLEWKAVTARR